MSDEPRRAHRRAPIEVEVSLESENNFFSGITNDISEGGVFVATVDTPPLGSEVTVLLKLGDGEPWRIEGVVRWIRDVSASCDGCPPGCGLQWIRISDEVLAYISSFVKHRDTILFDAA